MIDHGKDPSRVFSEGEGSDEIHRDQFEGILGDGEVARLTGFLSVLDLDLLAYGTCHHVIPHVGEERGPVVSSMHPLVCALDAKVATEN